MKQISRLLFQSILGRRLPADSGALRLEGPIAPIRIARDQWGIPYIEAQNDHDAWFGLGFCQGQDRAFQIETRLRVVRGTLAELIGPDGVPIDRVSRSIGFYRSAQAQLAALARPERELLEAFARGVTAGAARGGERLAHEFTLLRSRPTPYTAADVLGLLKLISFLLASNWDVEMARLLVAQLDGVDALLALDPVARYAREDLAELEGADARSGGRVREAVVSLHRELQMFFTAAGRSGGSNNWAVAPQRTRRGNPIVANDPHLPPGLPPHWYLAHVRTPQWRAVGACLAGAPGIIVGHNGRVAWGVTAGLIDNTDLFVEEIGPDGASVRRGDGFVPCQVQEETIAVKGGREVTLRLLTSDRGPVLVPDGPAGSGYGLAVRATWLEALPVVGFLKAHQSRTGEELRRLFEAWPSLPLNVVYADELGSIGWQLIGRAPVRRGGWGVAPAPAWRQDRGWQEAPVPYGEVPRAVDPPDGVVATANGRPPVEGGPFLGYDWLEEFRRRRIVESLLQRDDWDVAETLRLQTDVESLAWRSIRTTLEELSPQDPDARLALELMMAWDGQVTAGSTGAAVFEAFLAAMGKRVFRRKAPNAGLAFLGTQASRFTSRLIALLQERPAGWFEQSWDAEIEACLAGAVAGLRARYGGRTEDWAWGKVRPLTLGHPAGRGPLRAVFNRGPFAFAGDINTVAQGGVDPLDVTANPLAIASLRAVIEVGVWDEARFVLPGGESGNPCSPHYDDMLPLWLEGRAVVIPWSDAAVEARVRRTLSLFPAAHRLETERRVDGGVKEIS